MDVSTRSRLLPMCLLVLVFLVAGGLLSIPFLINQPLQVVRPGSFAVLNVQDLGGAATLRVDSAGHFQLIIEAPRLNGDPPHIALSMPQHDMKTVVARVQTIGKGLHRASGQLPMPSRWRVTISQGEQEQTLEFILAEF